ncbi:uncharacterized protein LOC105829175 [Monomorium pharaonis]|uniref:uncharacterized protein LOC105829175 n=1 Tax=Monomorium pharaonis TaxID=307658 RepID=UPI00063F3A40|nr:uncharacterized protein LOC105829175 [Monomorium pharaonis]
MGVLQFAEEFTRLIIYYTRTSNNDPSSNATVPLSNEQIVFTIQHVLDALKIKGFKNKNDNNPLEISNGTNAVINPETSLINIKRELDTGDTYRCSEDAQSVFTNTDSPVSDISLPITKKERENSFNTLQNEKKFLSRSNPAIYINNISRSDTFVREENQKSINQSEDQEDVFNDTTNAEQHNDLNCLQTTLKEIRKSTINIIMKLNNLEQSFPQGFPNDVQQLSSISNYSSPRRISTIKKTKVPSNTNRRSSVMSSRTPTPSKLFPVENGTMLERRKSTGGIRINVAIEGKSARSIKVTETSNQNSQQIMNLSGSSKASPGLSTEVQPKFKKNPKYAHIKSTIPKVISQKKKI